MQQPNRRALFTLCGVVLLLMAGLLLSIRGLSSPIALAQTDVEPGITAPEPGSNVSDSVAIIGSATHPAFQRYELYYKLSAAGEDAYIYFGGGEQAVIDDLLGRWDTAGLLPNTYDLRLRVVRADGNYSEYVVPGLQVGATVEEATPLLTTTATTTATVVPTATPSTTESVELPATITATAVPSPTTEPATETDLPADAAQLLTDRNLNVRGGPSTDYPVVTTLSAGDRARIIGRNDAGDWWQIVVDGIGEDGTGWVLGRLVTADNTGNVPVVAVAAPPVAPTATLTPVVTTAVTETVDTEETGTEETDTAEATPKSASESVSVVEGNAPAAIGPTGPITVTLTGDAENPAGLAALLRMVLLSFSSGDAVVTATVGALPDDLPITLTVPPTATVVGVVERAGDFAGQQIYLAAEGTAETLLGTMRDQLLDQGFTPPAQTAQGGSGQVFLSSDPRTAASLLCAQDGAVAVNLGTALLAGEGTVVTLFVTPVSRFGDPCSSDPAGAESAIFEVLPQLVPPPQAQVQGSGGGSSSGPDSVSLTAEATIETALTVAELADHYEGQLTAAGWEQVEQSRTDALTWSAWSFVDGRGSTWSVIFYLVEGSGEGEYIATLRAENRA